MRLHWLAFALFATLAGAQTPTGVGRVSYISGPTIYVDVGSKAGLREGAPLQVVRAGQVIAQLTVQFLSSTRAACTIASSTKDVTVGDSLRFEPSQSTAVAVQPVTQRTGRRQRASRLQGRLGARYLTTTTTGAATWNQPAFDVRLDGHRLGDTPLGLVVDVRAYRQRTAAAGRQPAAATRVYQGHLEWDAPNSPMRVTLGRQISPALSTLGIFDGAIAELGHGTWSSGFVAGSQPDAASFSMSGAIREYGAYLQRRSAVAAKTNWSVTLGGIGSYDHGAINREFGYLQSYLTSRYVSVFATQELDVNRGWKAGAENSRTTPTSSFVSLQLMPSDLLALQVGYDNRRNVRLYRDFVDPELEFDDAFRRGVWGGVSLRGGSHLRLDVDQRQSQGSAADRATSTTGSLGVYRLTALGLGAQLRHTTYSGATGTGSLGSAALEINPWDRFHLQFTLGQREDASTEAAPSRSVRWHELDGDLALGRSLFLMLSVYDETNAGFRTRQAYSALSWRF